MVRSSAQLHDLTRAFNLLQRDGDGPLDSAIALLDQVAGTHGTTVLAQITAYRGLMYAYRRKGKAALPMRDGRAARVHLRKATEYQVSAENILKGRDMVRNLFYWRIYITICALKYLEIRIDGHSNERRAGDEIGRLKDLKEAIDDLCKKVDKMCPKLPVQHQFYTLIQKLKAEIR